MTFNDFTTEQLEWLMDRYYDLELQSEFATRIDLPNLLDDVRLVGTGNGMAFNMPPSGTVGKVVELESWRARVQFDDSSRHWYLLYNLVPVR